MYGATFGAFISLLVVLAADDVSWWWLLWGSLLGLLFEILVRVGAGEEVGDALVSSIDFVSAVSDVGSGIGDFGGGGDSGGGDSGGGDGGGGGGGD